jgi:hypothetical protein
MSKKLAIQILNSHHVPYREIGDWLEVDEMYTIQSWIVCPRTVEKLLRQLGY